ncbi:hypothetical protein, partial [Pseudomonas kuykendallii]|uniref:Uncharacterized protein n=1 Tax=Pseudomonas kuykendallii TaxID=1007099 RepID=A0A2W5EUG8_9PSED
MFCLIKRILNGELIWWGVAVFQKMKRYFSMVIQRRRQLTPPTCRERPSRLPRRVVSDGRSSPLPKHPPNHPKVQL